ncbi:DUF4834 family protein [Aureitalea sp. L0-47]|uniref:DUF4834 family protein n=1 Tax=Aureitalea sp. L0-47 TaxID=2816962 RepID=UPI002237D6FB|nr:DUF4834 family protein [Aureitalea sp. L0-47]
MITFLKTVLIILLVYLGVKFLFKLLKPYIVRFLMKKAGKQFERSFGANPFQEPEPTKKEGSVTIDKMPPKKRKATSTVGEYVDYEEID